MMDFVSLLAAVPEHTNYIAQFIEILHNGLGNFGVTVIIFTLIFKFALLPLDLWQKFSMRKQSKTMAKLKPQLEKLEKQYANKPELLKQKQAELQRGQMTGMLGSCLPMIVTMVVFFVVLGGFNDYIRVENEKIVYAIADAYNKAVATGAPLTNDALWKLYPVESFLWIKNIYMPDTWSAVIPTMEQYLGSGMGALNAARPDTANMANWYNTLVGPAVNHYGNWNGYLILPILSIITSVVSAKLMSATQATTVTGTKEQQKSAQKTQKYMNYLMPVLFGVFSLFYSSAFALYIFISSLFSTIFGLIFNLIAKSKDKKAEAIA
ncbi:MAG: membrane protein insertase YidC [Clostridia bacterium]|nr:membrane protein insertase YidC [Clostridia bacterium]